MNPTLEEKERFIEKVRAALDRKNYQYIGKLQKLRTTMARLGIILDDVIDDIRSLTAHDPWTKEPDNQFQYPGDVWICIKQLRGHPMYIKLKFKPDNDDFLLIFSYHFEGMY